MTPDAEVGMDTRRGTVRVDRSEYRDERSLGELVRELTAESSTLLRQEVELAKSELHETVHTYTSNAGALAIGGALLLAALFGVLITINRGLTVLLANMMDVEIAIWLAPLILTVVIGLVGLSMVKKAMNAIGANSLVPKQTIETLQEEKQWIAQKVK